MNTTTKKKPGSAAAIAEDILSGNAEKELENLTAALEDNSKSAATQAARVVEEIITRQPELAIPHIEKLVRLLTEGETRVVQTCANSLPLVARVAPAKVAKHLQKLKNSFGSASDVGKDGIVRTFASLCIASIAYQKRLIGILETALSGADSKALQSWAELLLPALKGEPHAQARQAVEKRLNEIPRTKGRKIAAALGIKLRPVR